MNYQKNRSKIGSKICEIDGHTITAPKWQAFPVLDNSYARIISRDYIIKIKNRKERWNKEGLPPGPLYLRTCPVVLHIGTDWKLNFPMIFPIVLSEFRGSLPPSWHHVFPRMEQISSRRFHSLCSSGILLINFYNCVIYVPTEQRTPMKLLTPRKFEGFFRKFEKHIMDSQCVMISHFCGCM